MKRYLLMTALAAMLAVAPTSIATYAYAEEGYSDMERDTGSDAEPMDQQMDQGEWIADEPAGMEGGDAYDPELEGNSEQAQ